MFEGDSGVRMGTSSWSEKSWVGSFYPEATGPADFLKHYSLRYDTVEIDSTYYATPRDSTVRNWRTRTPDQFLFTAKVPREITHERVLVEARESMEIFVETMQWLGEKMGPLLLQFPYFNRNAFSGPAPFLKRLEQFLPHFTREVSLVVEVRNPTWIHPNLVEVVEGCGASLAWVDQGWMPHAQEWVERLGPPRGQNGYFRFLGDRKEAEALTQTWDQQVLDPKERLQPWVEIMKSFRVSGGDVFGFFNNHYAGHAPATLEDFRTLWSSDHSSSSSGE